MSMINTLLIDFAAIIAALIVGVVTYILWIYTYWQRKGFPYLKVDSIFGSLQNPLNRKEAFGDQMKMVYNQTRKRHLKYCGFYSFGAPYLLVADLDLLKNILAKDFSYFTDRGLYYNEKDEPISAHVFAVGGSKWRNLRTKLTPTFTSGKIKMMFQTLVECTGPLLKALDQKIGPIEIKNIVGRYTTNVIGSCAFGLDFNTFDDPNTPFSVYGNKAFEVDNRRGFKLIFANNYPNIARALHVKRLPTDVIQFYTKLVKDTVNYRQKTGTTRKDFLQLLIDQMGDGDDQFTIDEVVSQSTAFLLGGFETSATTLTFAFYELSKHQDVQDKVREEITNVLNKYDQNLTYDAINEMTYLRQVLNETFRMYPSIPATSRQCVKNYRIPGTDHVIEKGTIVVIPIYGIHLNPEYYPEPDKFDPERFNKKINHNREQFSFMPFGEGNRICIGKRFGILQVMVGLVAIIKNYRLTLNPRTVQPLRMSASTVVLSAEGGVWLDAEKIS